MTTDKHEVKNQLIVKLFEAASTKNYGMIDELHNFGVNLNCINEDHKTFIAVWCETYDYCRKSSYTFPDHPSATDHHLIDLQNITKWINYKIIDPYFHHQIIDIVNWCALNIIHENRSDRTELYEDFFKKIVTTINFNEDLLKTFNALLLKYASCRASQVVQILLLVPGIDVHQKNHENKDLLQIALNNNDDVLIKLLTPILYSNCGRVWSRDQESKIPLQKDNSSANTQNSDLHQDNLGHKRLSFFSKIKHCFLDKPTKVVSLEKKFF